MPSKQSLKYHSLKKFEQQIILATGVLPLKGANMVAVCVSTRSAIKRKIALKGRHIFFCSKALCRPVGAKDHYTLTVCLRTRLSYCALSGRNHWSAYADATVHRTAAVRVEVRDFAVERGLYVIQQSGENVEVIPPVGKLQVW